LYAAFTLFSSNIGGGLVSIKGGGCVTGSTPQKSSFIVAKLINKTIITYD